MGGGHQQASPPQAGADGGQQQANGDVQDEQGPNHLGGPIDASGGEPVILLMHVTDTTLHTRSETCNPINLF